ncbi:MAG: hypothetical protein GY861_25445 [bacterium]|nr:hypothetical protein [bacterium]
MCEGGVCICIDGFKGETCERHECPNDCSANGICSSSGKCECEDGFYGIFRLKFYRS